MVQTEDSTMVKKSYKNVALGLTFPHGLPWRHIKMHSACHLFNIIALGLNFHHGLQGVCSIRGNSWLVILYKCSERKTTVTSITVI